MKLLCDVRLEGVDPDLRRRDAGEGQDVIGNAELGLADDGVAEGDVDTERLPVDLPAQLAFGAEAEPVVLQSIVLDLGVVGVRSELEAHEIAQVETTRLLQPLEHPLRRAHHTQVDVVGGACAFQAQLEDEPSFERGVITEHTRDAGEKAIEDEELALARERGAAAGGSPQALLERLLECGGRNIGARGHAARPPNGASAVSTSPSSSLPTSPRRRAC